MIKPLRCVHVVVLSCGFMLLAGCGSTCHNCQTPPSELQLAYVANYQDNTISGFVIDASTGMLTPTSAGPFPAGTGPFSIAVVPSGKYAYVANAGSNDVSGYSIDLTSGAMTPLPGSPFPAGANPAGIAVDSAGKFLYVLDYQSSDIAGFSIDANTGALTAIPGSPFPSANEVID